MHRPRAPRINIHLWKDALVSPQVHGMNFHSSLSQKKKKPVTLYQIIMYSWSVQFSRSVVSDSLQPHEPQHTRPPCPSPTPGVHPNPCPSSQWCHPTILSSVIPFSSCPQSFPASESFQMSQLFASGGQSIRVSASTSVLPVNTQDWYPMKIQGSFPLSWLIWSPCCPKNSKESSPAPQFKVSIPSVLSLLYGPTLTSMHDYGKNHSFDYMNLFRKVMSLLFNTLSRFVIAFLPRSKCLNSMAAVTVISDFGAQENEVCHCFHFFPYVFAMKWRDWMPWFSPFAS